MSFNGYSHLNGNRPEFDGWLEKHNNGEFLQKNVPEVPVFGLRISRRSSTIAGG